VLCGTTTFSLSCAPSISTYMLSAISPPRSLGVAFAFVGVSLDNWLLRFLVQAAKGQHLFDLEPGHLLLSEVAEVATRWRAAYPSSRATAALRESKLDKLACTCSGEGRNFSSLVARNV